MSKKLGLEQLGLKLPGALKASILFVFPDPISYSNAF